MRETKFPVPTSRSGQNHILPFVHFDGPQTIGRGVGATGRGGDLLDEEGGYWTGSGGLT